MFEKSRSRHHAVSQPSSITLTLKTHQLTSIRWMTDIEKRKQRNVDWWMSCCITVNRCPLLFNLLQGLILIPPVEAKGLHGNLRVSVKGGILAGQ